MNTTYIWLLIAILYGILAIATWYLSKYMKRYINYWTKSKDGTVPTWYKEKGEKVIKKWGKETPFFEPIERYLRYMTYIDIGVFLIAIFIAIWESKIIFCA